MKKRKSNQRSHNTSDRWFHFVLPITHYPLLMNVPPEDRPILEQMAIECESLKNEPPVPVYLPKLAALALVTQIQLALRHPENKGWNAEQGKSIARELQALFNKNSATYQILEKGWHEEFDRTPANGKTEVHNVYTLYEMDEAGNQREEKLLSFFRPQDWGNPQRWHYHYCRIEIDRYISHCHVWQEVRRSSIEAMGLIASTLFGILIPGHERELCDRSHLAEDDFWLPEWGEMPPYYYEQEEDF